jgi:hypothetical protein
MLNLRGGYLEYRLFYREREDRVVVRLKEITNRGKTLSANYVRVTKVSGPGWQCKNMDSPFRLECLVNIYQDHYLVIEWQRLDRGRGRVWKVEFTNLFFTDDIDDREVWYVCCETRKGQIQKFVQDLMDVFNEVEKYREQINKQWEAYDERR